MQDDSAAGQSPDDRIPVEIPSTGYVRIDVPPQATAPAPALLVVHGYGQPPRRLIHETWPRAQNMTIRARRLRGTAG